MPGLPPPWLFPITLVLTVVAVEGGYRIGVLRRLRGGEAGEPVGAAVGATLGLLAFILAFTFGMASSRYDARIQLVLDETNAIGTCYLRTELLDEPARREAQRVLTAYSVLRAGALELDAAALEAGVAESKQLHTELWRLAVGAARADPTPSKALFVSACNDLFDLHEERFTKGLESRIPFAVWLILYVVALVAMLGLGYQVGLADDRRSLGTLFLFVTFSIVIALIADLDDSRAGFLRVSQRPLQRLAAELEASAPN